MSLAHQLTYNKSGKAGSLTQQERLTLPICISIDLVYLAFISVNKTTVMCKNVSFFVSYLHKFASDIFV